MVVDGVATFFAADIVFWHFGAVKSISLSCKKGIDCIGVGINHLLSLDVLGVSSRIQTAE